MTNTVEILVHRCKTFKPQQHAAEVVPANAHYTRSDCREMSTPVPSPHQHPAREILLNLTTHTYTADCIIVTGKSGIMMPQINLHWSVNQKWRDIITLQILSNSKWSRTSTGWYSSVTDSPVSICSSRRSWHDQLDGIWRCHITCHPSRVLSTVPSFILSAALLIPHTVQSSISSSRSPSSLCTWCSSNYYVFIHRMSMLNKSPTSPISYKITANLNVRIQALQT